jgi:KIF-1 binding protein C terminal
LERLTVGSAFFREKRPMDKAVVAKKFVDFAELQGKVRDFQAIVDSIKDFKDIEDAKTLFRLGNTQFKRALEYFKLDGHVTEHV